MSYVIEFTISGGDFSNAGSASSRIKKVLKQLNVEPRSIRRIVVAVYEAEVNIVAHAFIGKLTASFGEDEVSFEVADNGPGIEDIDIAMKPGYSTASSKVREMGFGAGMGLNNIKKNTDQLEIISLPGIGTTLKFRCIY